MPQKALLESFKGREESTNPYNIPLEQHSARIYSIMHAGIQKFGMELNGVLIRTCIDIEVKRIIDVERNSRRLIKCR